MSKNPNPKPTFNKPTLIGNEEKYVLQALRSAHASGNGEFTQRAHEELKQIVDGGNILLTTSCTAALEMASHLACIEPGDEVIMPSFTFASTANAVVQRGGVPVFVDIRKDTLNIDETLIEAAITSRTRAIFIVHYAGVGCQMDSIMAIAKQYKLMVVEDAAQALGAYWRAKPLGRFGALSAFSFHETKNLISGEGGALVVNDPDLVDRAEIIWEKGTNRVKFKRGEISKYTWVDVGGSYLPSEITAAFLLAQLEQVEAATTERLSRWHVYNDAFADLDTQGLLRRPRIPEECRHNGHIFYILAPSAALRERWQATLSRVGVPALIHYVPLHSAPAGLRFGRVEGPMTVTDDISSRLLRLPLHLQLTQDEQDYVIENIRQTALQG